MSPISQETSARSARSAVPRTEDVVDPSLHPGAGGPPPGSIMPSEVAPPTRVDEEPQQAATGPGTGSEVHVQSGTSFGEKVLGYAKKSRGTVLGKPELKERGQEILEGKANVNDVGEGRIAKNL